MKYYKLNKEKSLEIYNKKDILVEQKACYTNTFLVVNRYMDKFTSKEWRVAYGYMKISENENLNKLYCRHAFVLDQNDEVIDITLAFLCDTSMADRDINNELSDDKYIIMKVFDDVEDYIDTLAAEDGDVCLCMYLRDEYLKLQEWAWKNDIMLCG